MSVFIPCSKFIQPDTSQYALAFAKLTAQFLLLPSYNYRWVSVWGQKRSLLMCLFGLEHVYLKMVFNLLVCVGLHLKYVSICML